MERIINLFKRNAALAITVFLACLSLTLWLANPDEKTLGDLWLNLLAGFIASICTIAIVDNIIKRQKKYEQLPIRLALYRDVQLFSSRIISLWGGMYYHSVKPAEDVSTDVLFSPNELEKVFSSFDLGKKADVYPETDWFNHIFISAQELINRGNKILDRYINEADPSLIHAIHYLVNDGTLISGLKSMGSIRNFDIRENYPRSPLLRSYVLPPEEKDYTQITMLFVWCRNQYSELNGNEKGEIYPITEIGVHRNSESSSVQENTFCN